MKEVSFQESKFVEKFTIFASKMGNEIHLRSLRDAFATIMPLYILAGLAVLINNTVFVWLLSGDTLTGAQYWGTVITNGTLNISSLLIAPVIGYCLSRNKGFDNPMAAAIVSLAALVVMMPNVVSVTPLEGGESVAVSGALTFGNVGTQAMFAGVIIGLIATELFVWISGIKKLQIETGLTILLVSHSMEDVAEYVDRIIVMNKGSVMYDDTPREVFKHYKELEEVGLAAPQVTYIMHDLKARGADVDVNATTIEEAAEEIARDWKSKNA